MIKRGLLFVIFAVVFVLPIVASTTTDIIVKTAPNHDIMFSFYGANGGNFINRTREVSPANETTSIIYKNNGENVDIIIFISKFGKKVLTERFDNQETGGQLVYELYPDGYIPISQQVPGE